MQTELALDEKFDRQAFHDFLPGQDLLPEQLAAAMRTVCVPKYKAKP